MNPARSRCTGGRNASISTAKMLGGWASGSSTVLPCAFLKGFSASSLRRYCEMLLAIVWAVPRTRGSSLWPPRASVHAAASRPSRRAQRASPRSERDGLRNSSSSSSARSRVEHCLAVRLLEGLLGELAAQVLRDAAGDRVGRATHPRIVAVAAPGQRARGGLAAQPPSPTRQP